MALQFPALLQQISSATEINAEVDPETTKKVSRAFGHMVGNNIESLTFRFDIAEVIQGLTDQFEGKPSPMSEAELTQTMTDIQDQVFQKLALSNLKAAEAFLKENIKLNNVFEIENSKLQYKVLNKGFGNTVENDSTPFIRYIGRFINGKEFGKCLEGQTVNFKDLILGLKKGIIGMKESEKRNLYIHPDLGYGTSAFLPPNSLLIFEIEVIRANS